MLTPEEGCGVSAAKAAKNHRIVGGSEAPIGKLYIKLALLDWQIFQKKKNIIEIFRCLALDSTSCVHVFGQRNTI